MNEHVDLETIAIERACERLLVRFFHLIDFGEASRVADLFTEDGVWQIPGRTTSGREEIRKVFAEREEVTDRRSMHVLTNALVTVDGPTEAHAVSYFMLFRKHHVPEGQPAPVDGFVTAGDYLDRFVLTDEGWRIAERRTNVRFYNPE